MSFPNTTSLDTPENFHAKESIDMRLRENHFVECKLELRGKKKGVPKKEFERTSGGVGGITGFPAYQGLRYQKGSRLVDWAFGLQD